MDHLQLIRSRRWLTKVTSALTVAFALMLLPASLAHAGGTFEFFPGKTLAGHAKYVENYWGNYLYEVAGSGVSHSVCTGAVIGATEIGHEMCSSGPGQGVYNTSMNDAFGFPYIENNAAGSTVATGSAIYVNPPEEGGGGGGGGGCGCSDPYRYMLGTSNGAGIASWGQLLKGMSNPVMRVGDFTGDGKADIVSAESEGNGWDRYMLGTSNGSGVSTWGQILHGMTPPAGFVIGDFTGDGKGDIVAIEEEKNNAGKYQYMLGVSGGNGINTWDAIRREAPLPAQAGLGDFNGDGKADLFVVEPEGNGKYSYKVGISNGKEVSSWITVRSGAASPYLMRIGDVTGDGKADIVTAESEGNGNYRYMLGTSNGSGLASWNQVLGGMAYPRQMRVGDLTGDGKADIVAAESEGNGNDRFMLGTSTGSGFKWSGIMSGMEDPTQFGVGDFTGDGKADIISVESYTE